MSGPVGKGNRSSYGDSTVYAVAPDRATIPASEEGDMRIMKRRVFPSVEK